MNAVELTEFLIKNLVKEPDMVSVKQLADEDDSTVIQVLVDNNDMGAVIGRSGNIAKAIRVLVQASAYATCQKRVRIDIDSF
jgi:predicted RNA-binding protein YlqC (UPF0109 family)